MRSTRGLLPVLGGSYLLSEGLGGKQATLHCDGWKDFALSFFSSSSGSNNKTMTQKELKKLVGYRAVDSYVRDNMVIGLGTGSTAYFAVERVGQLLQEGKLHNITAVSTSTATQNQAQSLGIPLSSLEKEMRMDVTIDGADEVSDDFQLVKGRGGALFREKMVELNSDKLIIIVDESKLVTHTLDQSTSGLPVEIVPFSWEVTVARLQAALAPLSVRVELRTAEINTPYVTDNGNYIIDVFFEEAPADIYEVARALKSTTGVVEHGLFLGMTDAVIIGKADNTVEVRENKHK